MFKLNTLDATQKFAFYFVSVMSEECLMRNSFKKIEKKKKNLMDYGSNRRK